jgi:hypothetical protein
LLDVLLDYFQPQNLSSQPLNPISRVPACNACGEEKNRDGSKDGNWTELLVPVLEILHLITLRDR